MNKRLPLIGLALAASLAAQCPDGGNCLSATQLVSELNPQLTPYGPWKLCQQLGASSLPAGTCANAAATAGQYTITATPTSERTIGFGYRLVLSDGRIYETLYAWDQPPVLNLGDPDVEPVWHPVGLTIYEISAAAVQSGNSRTIRPHIDPVGLRR